MESEITENIDVWRMSTTGIEELTEKIAREVAVEFRFDSGQHFLLSCTPSDLDDFVYGFSFSIGAIDSLADISSYDIDDEDDGFIMADIELAERSGEVQLPVSCIPADLDAFWRTSAVPHRPKADIEVSAEAIWKTSGSLLSWQRMHQMTGATHAAAFIDQQGNPICVREDIGRHSAVDKMVGALLRWGISPASGFAYLSSRCALDLVMRCVRYGIAVVATVSAPTSAVVAYAEEAGVTLCAFARDGRFTVYTHPERIIFTSR